MKKIVFCVFVIFVVVVLGVGANFKNQIQTDADDILRIHIRADSNNQNDQSVKYDVRNRLVSFLTPYLCNAETKAQAMNIVKGLLHQISVVAKDVLSQNGFDYGARAVLTEEVFPLRCYDDVVLEGGKYDALVVLLGSGTGDNWWCVVYPPLCFVAGEATGGTKIEYVSKFKEIIQSFKQKYID